MNEIKSNIDIGDIIKNESIIIHYQPIICIRKKCVIGVEALCRGINGNEIVSPDVLFYLAKKESMVVELDRLCRKKAMEGFAKFINAHPQYKDLILFINFESSIIDKGVLGSNQFLNMVNQFNLSPNKIGIEILESQVDDTRSLKEFVEAYREYGFIVVLDDVGKGHSNLNRLNIVKPDILKIDISIIRDVDKEFYKQEIMRSLVNLSKKVGAIVVAEGIESEKEALTALSIGVDMLQGYYFSRPSEIEKLPKLDLEQKNAEIAGKLKNHILDSVNLENALRREYDIVINKMIFKLSTSTIEEFDQELEHMADMHNKIECVYILDSSGIQVSSTICNASKISTNKISIFEPAAKGTDHSIKNYYYLAISSLTGMYITEPYISMASGNLCITISTVFLDTDGSRYILCLDARYNEQYR